MARPASPALSIENLPAEVPELAELVGYLDHLTDRADLAVLSQILEGLTLTRADLEPAIVFGKNGYRRNVIRRGEWYELLALCWRSGHSTPIHDHRGSSCAFRVIEGVCTEVRYLVTPSGQVCPSETHHLQAGSVCAAEDSDIHQVANLQAAGEDLITLHIYSPAIRSMNTYAFTPPGRCDDLPCD